MGAEKRKRALDTVASNPSSKRVAFDSAAKTRVRHINASEGLHPILVTCPGIEAPPSIVFTAYSNPRCDQHALGTTHSVKPASHNVILHSSEHPRLDYIAAPNETDQHLTHYLAVFDQAANQLDVIPAHHLNLRSTLHAEAQELEGQSGRSTTIQQREELGREFGTKKAKKAIASKTVNAIVNLDVKDGAKMTHVQNAILQTVADATAGDASATEQAEARLAAKPVPKPNPHAKSVDDIYPLSSLLPPAEYRQVPIKDWRENARNEIRMDFNHRVVAFRVAELGKRDDSDKLKALGYLSLLLEFHDVLSTAGRSGKKVPKKEILDKRLEQWPSTLVDGVRRRFADSSGQALGKWHMDNLYSHMCALNLYIDGWKTEIGNLRDDLKMDLKQMSRYFIEIGCKVKPLTETERVALQMKKVPADATRMAHLTFPPEFPRPRTGRTK